MMRLTQNMLVDRSSVSLQTSLNRLAKTQETLSTGKVLNRPSDSPTDTSQAMRVRASLAEHQQYVRNAQDGIGWLSTTDTTLSAMTNDVRRVNELALQGANAATSPAGREAIAIEVDQLRESLLALANTTHLGRPIFGGVTAGRAAYEADGTYAGSAAGEVRRAVADGVSLRVDVRGPDVVGADGANLFDDLTALSAALRGGDQDGIRVGIEAVQGRLTTLGTAQATVGAAYNRAESAVRKGQDAILALRTELSSLEDTDLPRAMIDLQVQEMAYQAALASTSRVLQPSLVDFLR